jgi:hypothetical protein
VVWSAPNLVPRAGHAATLLHDGRVLVVGGSPSASSCEKVFDNSLNLHAVYHHIGTPWALCITKGGDQFLLYSASNPDKGESHRTVEIYKLELDGTILGKVVGDEAGKMIVTLQHIDCRESNTLWVSAMAIFNESPSPDKLAELADTNIRGAHAFTLRGPNVPSILFRN